MSIFSSRFFLCLCVLLVTYAVAFGMRLQELPAWGIQSTSIQGEKLQATHDAYFWLAGAKGTSRRNDAPLAKITTALHSISGVQYGNIGFWLPAVLAPLAVVPIIFLGWRWGLEDGALPAGVLASCCLGFLLRTRFGFYDTDILSLFFPLLFCSLLVILFSKYLRAGWLKRDQSTETWMSVAQRKRFTLECLVLGLVGLVYMWFYPKGNSIVLVSLAALSLCISVLSDDWQKAGWLALGLLIIYGCTLCGPIGWVGVVALLGLAFVKPRLMEHSKGLLACLCLLALLVFLDSNLFNLVTQLGKKVLIYAKFFSAETSEGGLSLPSILQSVREAQTLDWSNMVSRLAGNWFIFIPAILGVGYIVWVYPTTLVFLPMLGLSLFSFKLGNRFTMYGGAVLGIGLGFGLSHLMARYGLPRLLRFTVQIIVCFLVAMPAWRVAADLGPAPILPKPYAQTLIDLKEESSAKARLWQWWDYGYAAQYYAERISFGDGGNHQGDVLYPLSKVHMTHSPRQAKQLMEYITVSQEKEYTENATEYKNMPEFWKPYLADPVAELEELGPEQARSFVRSLADEEKDWTEDIPPQYFVVSWENMRLAYWISYYGTWDLVTGKASPGKIQRVRGNVRFDLQNGALKMAKRQVSLSGMDVLEQRGNRHFDWPNGTGVYAVLNRVTQELYLMDATIYKSMMVQMLVRDPERFDEHFELKVDRGPWARAYVVKQ